MKEVPSQSVAIAEGPVHPCVAICVGMLLIVIGPFAACLGFRGSFSRMKKRILPAVQPWTCSCVGPVLPRPLVAPTSVLHTVGASVHLAHGGRLCQDSAGAQKMHAGADIRVTSTAVPQEDTRSIFRVNAVQVPRCTQGGIA